MMLAPYTQQMQTAGVVVLCLFGGAFFVIITAGLATLIVLHVRLQKQTKDLLTALGATQASFKGIREEMRTQLGTSVRDIQTALSKINAEALEAASLRALRACLKIEKAGDTLMAAIYASQPDTGDEDVSNVGQEGLGPEEYGPEDVYVQKSGVARADANLDAEEAKENAPQFATSVD